SFRHTKL
ncbi:hypothetical protein D039_1264B, partial [Vibrio parahaemolyticus EKP-028]